MALAGQPGSFVILHGPHGYFVEFVGVTERAAINKEYEEMLARLCKSKKSGACRSKGQELTCRPGPASQLENKT